MEIPHLVPHNVFEVFQCFSKIAEASGGLLELLEASWGLLGACRGALRVLLGASWVPLGISWGLLVASWWSLGSFLGVSWVVLGITWSTGEAQKELLLRLWGALGASWPALLGPLGLLSKPLGAGALGLSQNAVGSLLEASWENFAGVFQVSEIKNSSHLICQLPSLRDERGAMRGAFE